MRTCNGCGGILGRDCFNPQECEMISHNEQQYAQQQSQQAIDEVSHLRIRIEALEEILKRNGLH